MKTNEKVYTRKKVGIIYDGKRAENWDINCFRNLFEQNKVEVTLFDANKLADDYSEIKNPEEISLSEIDFLTQQGYMIWMNRVYPSETDQSTINKGLNIISWLNSRNLPTINPLTACAADYDKFFAWQLMSQYAVPTPKSGLINKESISETIINDFFLPLVIKRRTGGKALGVIKVNSKNQLEKLLEDSEIISGRYFVQEFVEPKNNYDIRVGVIGGDPLISYGRTLVGEKGETPWMGSCYHGSKIISHKATEEEKHLAVLASKSIGANLNEVDIQITKKGPVVIENNPTPGYAKGEEHWVKLIVNHILKTF